MRLFNRFISVFLLLAILLSFPGSVLAGEESPPAADEYYDSAPADEGPDIAAPAAEGDSFDDEPGSEADADILISEEDDPAVEPDGTTDGEDSDSDPDADSTYISEDDRDDASSEGFIDGGEYADDEADYEDPSADDSDDSDDIDDSFDEAEPADAGLPWRTIVVEPEQPDLYDEWDYTYETLNAPERLWQWLFGRWAEPAQLPPSERDEYHKEAEPDEGALILEISGYLPEDVTAVAKCALFDEDTVYSEIALAAVELALYDGNGDPYVPDVNGVTVTVGGRLVNRAVYNDMPMLVYAYKENEQREYDLNKYAADVLVYRDAFGDNDRRRYVDDTLGSEVRFYESYRGLVVYTDNTIDFKTDASSLQFIVSAQVPDRLLWSPADDADVYVYGALSDSVTAEVQALDAEYCASDISGSGLVAVDISLNHEDAGEFEADLPLLVTISDDSIAEALSSDDALEVWQLNDNGAAEQVEDAVFYGGSVQFEAEGQLSYVVVNTTLEKTLTASDGKTYHVSVTYDNYSGIPAGAVLSVNEIVEADGRYEGYISESAETLDVPVENITFARAFDIALIDPATGEEYQPTKDIQVSIDLLSDNLDEAANVGVVHFGEETELVDAAVNGAVVEFEAGGFSVYVVASYTVDFHWGSYTYNLAGGGSILLSELLNALNITEVGLGDVVSVSFSDPSLVEVEALEGDWQLTSLQAFDTGETLSLTLTNGQIVTITVTDAADEVYIGTTPYPTLADALAAVNDGETIKLNTSVAAPDVIDVSGKTFFIDLNEFELTNANGISFDGNSTIQIRNGTLAADLTANGSTLILASGVTVNGSVTCSSNTLTVNNGAAITGAVTVNGGTLIANGGTFSGAVTVGAGTAVINSGIFSGDVTVNAGDVNISGGTFNGNVTVTGGTVTVTGGSFAYGLPTGSGVTVTGTVLSIYTDSTEKDYDGTELTCESYSNVTGLASGDRIASITYTGRQTNKGTSANTATGVVVKDSTDNDVTSRYIIAVNPGTLTVNPASVTVRVNNTSKVTGAADPAFTATVSGLKNNDQADVIHYTITRPDRVANPNDPDYAASELSGEHPLLISCEEDQGNYHVTSFGGTLNILKLTITFKNEDENGESTFATARLELNEELGTQLPDAAQNGDYTFKGWSRTKGPTTVYTTIDGNESFTENTTLYARYTYKVTFMGESGTVVEERIIDEGNPIGELPNDAAAIPGCTLENWYTDTTWAAGSKVTSASEFTRDIPSTSPSISR